MLPNIHTLKATPFLWMAIGGVFALGLAGFLTVMQLAEQPTAVPAQAAGNTYYVSLTGSDSNTGSQSAPFKTFNYAKRVLQPGDTLRIFGGTYTEPIDITQSGTANAWISILPVDGQQVTIDVQNKADRGIWLRGNYLKVAGLTVKNADWSCVVLSGEYNSADSMSVSACQSHSLFAGGKHNSITRSVVHDSVLENQDRSSNWGSAIKVERGAEDVTIDGNTVYRNFGEGIGITMGKNVRVTNNIVYDNFSVNIYIDNSMDVLVEGNIAGCTGYSATLRSGNRPAALSLAEEVYSGWGSQLANITVRNNALVFCSSGISDYGADGAGGGLDHVTIEHNTVWSNTATALDLSSDSSKTRNTVVSRNIFHRSAASRSPHVADLAGITLHDNFWVTTMPGVGDKARGANDMSGTPIFAGTPVFNDFNSLRQAANSPARDYGIQFGGSVVVPTPTVVLPSITLVPTIVPTTAPTLTKTPTPTRTPTPTVTLIPTLQPSVTITRTPSSTPTPTNVALPSLAPTTPLLPSSTPVPTSATYRVGDINTDGKIDGTDLDLLVEVYGASASALPRADLNLDGRINALDYVLLLDLLNS